MNGLRNNVPRSAPRRRWIAVVLTMVLVATLGGAGNAGAAAEPGQGVEPGDVPTTCKQLRQLVKVRYEVVAKPTSYGKRIFVRVVVRNDSGKRHLGRTGGFLKVDESIPGSPKVIDWGGSSADDLVTRKMRTSQKKVFGASWFELQVPRGARVIRMDRIHTLGGYGWSYGLDCMLPSAVIAPRGLVKGHPRGRWYVTLAEVADTLGR